MASFIVRTQCNTDANDFDTRGEAQQALDDHAKLCQTCDRDSIELDTGTDEMEGEVEVIDENPDRNDSPEVPDDGKPQETSATHPEKFDLPEDGPSVDEDPLVWMPDEFTDTIDGTIAINRKGYEVMAHHYEIECTTEIVTGPVESEYTVAVMEATAVDADGDVYSAYGEAHVDDVDVSELVRYADTRAYKRAVSRATGVGMVAVEELQGGL